MQPRTSGAIIHVTVASPFPLPPHLHLLIHPSDPRGHSLVWTISLFSVLTQVLCKSPIQTALAHTPRLGLPLTSIAAKEFESSHSLFSHIARALRGRRVGIGCCTEEVGSQTHPLPISRDLPVGLGNRCASAMFVSGALDLTFRVPFLGPEESERENGGLSGHLVVREESGCWEAQRLPGPPGLCCLFCSHQCPVPGPGITESHYSVPTKRSKCLLISETGGGHGKNAAW